MPKEQIVIEQFTGVKQSADPRGIDLQSASHMIDIDPITKQGELRGRLADEALNGTFLDADALALFRDGTEAIIFDGTNLDHLTAVNTLPAASGVTSTPTTSGEGSIASFGNSVRVGLGNTSSQVPQWVGFIEHGQFGGSAPSGTTHIRNAPLIPPVVTGGVVTSATAAASAEETIFEAGTRYLYAISFEYDGYQSSTLDRISGYAVLSGGFANGAKQIDITFTLTPANVPDRVTGVYLFRNEVQATVGDDVNDLWRLVDRIDINDGGWTLSGSDYDYTYQDTGKSQQDWESFTGLPDKTKAGHPNDDIEINYQYNEELNGFHFVSKVYHAELSDTDTWMFRSLRNRPDMFNWAEDYLVLPTQIHTLKGFLGRLYAFAEGVVYRIDPETFQVEDVIDGIGASGPQSVITTERGMFFCNKENLFVHDGQQIRAVGYPVLDNDYDNTISWRGASHGVDPVVTYDGSKDIFIAIFESSSAIYHGFCYYLPDDTWYTYNFGNIGGGAPTIGFTTHDGKPIAIFSGTFVHIGGSSTRTSWKWVSKEINNGIHELVMYGAFVDGDAGTLIVYEECETPYTINLSNNADYDGCIHRVRINSQVRGVDGATSWGRWNKFSMELNGTNADTVNAIGALIRRVKNKSYGTIQGELLTDLWFTALDAGVTAAPLHGIYKMTPPDDVSGVPWFTNTTPWSSPDNWLILSDNSGSFDMEHIKVDKSAGYVFVQGNVGRYLYRHDLDGNGSIDTGTSCYAFAIDRTNQKIYAYGGTNIDEYDYDLNLIRTVHTRTASDIGGIGVDQSGTYLFFHELNGSGTSEIVTRLDLSSLSETTVYTYSESSVFLNTTVIDEAETKMFVSRSTGPNFSIYSMDYPDGANPTLLVSAVGSVLALDRANQKVIYDNLAGDLFWMNYDGTGNEEILTMTLNLEIQGADVGHS